MRDATEILPWPKLPLCFGDVSLRFEKMIPGAPGKGFAPYYHFRIITTGGADVGHINFRVGNTEHVTQYAGHIGFQIAPEFRGQRYAFQACRALGSFVRSIYNAVIITCDPENIPSRRTIERLGGRFLNEVPVPPGDPHYERGSRIKRRYEWVPEDCQTTD